MVKSSFFVRLLSGRCPVRSGKISKKGMNTMTKTIKKMVTATILLMAVMMLPLLSNMADATGINVSVPTQYYRAGDTINATIICTPTRWIKAWELTLVFSKSTLQATTVIEGSFFKPSTTFFSPGIINNINGSIKNLYDLPVGVGNATATKPIFYVMFTAKAYGQASINLTNVGVCNETMYLPGIIVSNTSFYVYSPYDMNVDKTIGMPDLIDVAGHYHQTGAPGWIKEDVNKDGIITLLDIILTAIHWGPY